MNCVALVRLNHTFEKSLIYYLITVSEGRRRTKHDFRDDLGSANLTYPPMSTNNLYISSKLRVSGGKTDLSLSSINKSPRLTPTRPVCIERMFVQKTQS